MTVLFNLDAAVVLLTPLYVRIAARHGDDPVALAFIPALMASLASTVLPVSNLTNLVVVEHIDLGAGDFLRHAAPAAIAAVVVGWFAYRAPRSRPPAGRRPGAARRSIDGRSASGCRSWCGCWSASPSVSEPACRRGSSRRSPSDGDRRVDAPPAVATVPVGPAVLALALGTLAVAAAPDLHLDAAVRDRRARR